MGWHRSAARFFAVVAAVVCMAAARPSAAPAATDDHPARIQVAQEAEPSPLRPRDEPVPPPEKSWYNSSYLFGMTRGVANSTLVPAAKAPLFLLTVPLDIVLLPFEAIGGCFG